MSSGHPRLFPVAQEQLTSDDYYTPAWVFERMGIEFDFDVCSPPGGIPWIPAKRHFTQADDGLLQPWEGRVWMNPPFSKPRPWIQKFRDHLKPPVEFHNGKGLSIPWPIGVAAYGPECVEAISRLGKVRVLA